MKSKELSKSDSIKRTIFISSFLICTGHTASGNVGCGVDADLDEKLYKKDFATCCERIRKKRL